MELVNLGEDATRILSEQEDPAYYVSEALKNRGWVLQYAAERLKAAGWLKNEVSAILEAVNGGWQYGPETVPPEMLDHPDVAREWKVACSRWNKLIEQLFKDPEIAFSLWIVVSEYWSGNTVAKRLVEGLEERAQATKKAPPG